MQCFARLPDGTLHGVQIEGDHRVTDLKDAVEGVTGIEKGKQCLWLNGSELQDENIATSALGLVAEDTIDVCLSGKEMALAELRKRGINQQSEWVRHYWNAVLDCNIPLLRLLLAAGISVEVTKGSSRKTALHIAAEHSNLLQVVELLIDSGADVDVGSRCGWTALCTASWNGNNEICSFLIESGSDVCALAEGKTALMHAASLGRLETCRCLITKGAELNTRSAEGYTALMLASTHGEVQVVQLLVTAGANTNVKQGKQTALTMARTGNHYEVVKILKRAGASAGECCVIC